MILRNITHAPPLLHGFVILFVSFIMTLRSLVIYLGSEQLQVDTEGGWILSSSFFVVSLTLRDSQIAISFLVTFITSIGKSEMLSLLLYHMHWEGNLRKHWIVRGGNSWIVRK
jgi:hypothetical protein